jgi:hypothetical protein
MHLHVLAHRYFTRGKQIMININQLIASLLAAPQTEHIADPAIPDGVMDCSSLVKALRYFTKDGRAMNASEEFPFNTLMGGFLHSILGESPADSEKDTAIATLTLAFVQVLRTVVELKPDLLVEEVLMDAFNQDLIRSMEPTFAAMPFQFGENDQLCPMWGHDAFFTKPIPRTLESDDGFLSRRISPFMDISETYDEVQPGPNRKISKERKEPLGELIADSMNGFDEYYELYWERQEAEESEDDF